MLYGANRTHDNNTSTEVSNVQVQCIYRQSSSRVSVSCSRGRRWFADTLARLSVTGHFISGYLLSQLLHTESAVDVIPRIDYVEQWVLWSLNHR